MLSESVHQASQRTIMKRNSSHPYSSCIVHQTQQLHAMPDARGPSEMTPLQTLTGYILARSCMTTWRLPPSWQGCLGNWCLLTWCLEMKCVQVTKGFTIESPTILFCYHRRVIFHFAYALWLTKSSSRFVGATALGVYPISYSKWILIVPPVHVPRSLCFEPADHFT